MAASGSQTIQLYYSTTSGASPVAGNLASGEIAININDGKLYYKDSSGNVQLLASKAAASGSFSDITASGNVTLTAGTANGVAYLNGSKVLTTGSALTFDGTNLGVGGTPLSAAGYSFLRVNGSTGGVLELTSGGTRTLQIQADSGTTATIQTIANGSNPPLIFGVNSSEQMRLTSTGLGIGTSSPGYKLEVRGELAASNGTYGTILTYSAGNQTGVINTYGNHGLEFRTNNTERMRLDTSGNLGIGTSSPSSKLDLVGVMQWQATAGTVLGKLTYSGGEPVVLAPSGLGLQFWTNNSFAAKIDSSGNLGIGTSSPSAKLHAYSGTSMGQITADGTGAIKTGMNFASAGTTYGQIYFDNNAPYDMSVMQQYSTGSLRFGTNNTERMRLDSSGNLGLGVTPSAWASSQKAIEFNPGGYGIASYSSGALQVFANAYYDGSWRYKGNGLASQYYQQTGQHVWSIAANNTSGAGAAITFTQAMTLDASGNLGVGQTSPGARLNVDSGSTGLMSIFNSTNANGGYITGQSSGSAIWDFGSAKQVVNTGGASDVALSSRSGFLAFGTGSTERARIDSSGNLLVGTTANRGQVSVQGYPTSLPTVNFYRDNTDANYVLAVRHDGPVIGSGGTGYMIQFQDRNGGALGTITSSGTGSGSTAYNTSSDYRLKHDVEPMANALVKVAALKPVTYKWNADNSDGQGFIAHELQEVFPEAVTGAKDEMEEYLDESDNTIKTRPRYQGIDTSFLVATLTAAIQEQQAIIETLTARVAALESK